MSLDYYWAELFPVFPFAANTTCLKPDGKVAAAALHVCPQQVPGTRRAVEVRDSIGQDVEEPQAIRVHRDASRVTGDTCSHTRPDESVTHSRCSWSDSRLRVPVANMALPIADARMTGRDYVHKRLCQSAKRHQVWRRHWRRALRAHNRPRGSKYWLCWATGHVGGGRKNPIFYFVKLEKPSML